MAKSANFSVQICTILKTQNPTREPGFSEIKTWNLLFQNLLQVCHHYLWNSLNYTQYTPTIQELTVFLLYLKYKFIYLSKDSYLTIFHRSVTISRICIKNDREWQDFFEILTLLFYMTKEIHQKNVVGNFLILHSGFPRSQEKREGIQKIYFCRSSSSCYFTMPDSKRNLLIKLLIGNQSLWMLI